MCAPCRCRAPPKSIREESRRDLDLAAVYTALMTQRTESASDRDRLPDRAPQRLSAMAVLNAEPHLALLGDPGSGKSTFVNFVALCMAGELLGRADAIYAVASRPPRARRGPSAARINLAASTVAAWSFAPARVILREFVSRGLPAAGETTEMRRNPPWRFIIHELPEPLRACDQVLQQEWLHSGGLLLLDGLDEVPEADQRRAQVKAAVEAFAEVFPRVRVLVTSRTYAYQRQDWKVKGFAEAVLAPFDEAQIRQFVKRWYAYVGGFVTFPSMKRRDAPCCSTRPLPATLASMSSPLARSCSPSWPRWTPGAGAHSQSSAKPSMLTPSICCSISGKVRSSDDGRMGPMKSLSPAWRSG